MSRPKEIDDSGDASLNRDELNVAMSKLDVPLSEAELDEFMMVLDPDGSGEVEICEFAILLQPEKTETWELAFHK